MEKIICNTKLKKLLSSILVVITLFQFMMPSIVFAKDKNIQKTASYQEWLTGEDTKAYKDIIEKETKKYLKNYYKQKYPENEEDVEFAVQQDLNNPTQLIITATLKPGSLFGIGRKFEIITIGVTPEGYEKNQPVTKKYDELLKWTGKNANVLDDEIVKVIIDKFFPGVNTITGTTPQEVGETILEKNKDTIEITVLGDKTNYRIIDFKVPGKDEQTLKKEAAEELDIPFDKDDDEGASGDDLETPDSVTTGIVDKYTGIILEPTVKFFTFVLDSIMSVFSAVMKGEEIQFVMVDKEDISTLPSQGEIGGTFTISDMKPYATASGKLEHLKYPRFSYSSEELFAGEIDLVNVNFISKSNDDESWLNIRRVVSQWYKILRMVAIVGLLSVLIYTGIKIIISSNSKDKAKYKELMVNWLVGVILAFSMHYIMAFILNTVDEVTNLLQGLARGIQVNAGGTSFVTNLIGLARFQIQQQHFSAKVGHLIIYTALIVYTFKFTFLYFKRMLKMAFLTMISPIVALTYPIDKANDGKAQGFEMWLKEFLYNALLQPMHYILYYILVTTSLTLAARNPLYGIVALAFISQAEKLLKKIFGFDKAKAGTVGGVAGAFATGAITSSLISHIRDPLHPFGGGSSGKSSGKGSSGANNNYYDEGTVNFNEDTYGENNLLTFINNANNPQPVPGAGGVPYPVDNSTSRDDMIDMLNDYRARGGDLSDIPNLSALNNNELRDLIQNRANRNTSSSSSGGLWPNSSSRNAGRSQQQSAWSRFKQNHAMVRGAANVGRTLAKPVWDTQKDAKYNLNRIGKNVAKGVLGGTVGVAAAAVQAGISITDGKYNPIEGVGAVTAGIAGTSAVIDSIGSKKELNPEEKKSLEKYTQQWYNRDDIISAYNNEYGGEGKKRRSRAAKNYVSRGITDLEEQKQAMKFADLIKQERGLDEEEADKVAVATLQYRQNLTRSNNYMVLFDDTKKDDYLKVRTDSYTGSASKDSIRRLHEDLIENVRDFDRANR